MAETRRLFFALWPEPAVRDAIARAGYPIARQRALGGREVPPERLHLTLLFLGGATAAQQERLVAGAGQVVGHAFDLRLEQAGCFYRSRVFWLGAATAPARLTALWQSLCDVAALAGLEPDHRPPAPHVTLVRDIRHRIRPVPVEPVVWPVRRFALVQSVLGDRPEYHVVSQWPLQNASATNVKTVQASGGTE